MNFVKVKSYAKVNISLNITGRLSNGFHKIESLVSFINLYDLIFIKRINSKKHKVYFTGKQALNIKKKNTLIILLDILDKQRLLDNRKFEIKVVKNIPIKSGMGGGSMNAASLINFLFKKKILRLKKNKLISIADKVGSDVALGLEQQNTILSTNGKITRFKKKFDYHVLIVKPNFGCSTSFIYSKVKYFSKSKYNTPKLSHLSLESIKNSENKLEKIAFSLYPKLKNLKLFLLTLPNIIFARMSGSGSSIVAYFHSKKAADSAAKEFKKKFNNYWFITSKTI